MKVYKMNDYEWIASNWDARKTLDWYLKETGLSEEDNPLEDVRECDLDKDGMWWECLDREHINELEAQGITKTLKTKKPQFGNLEKVGNRWYVYIPFREALKRYGFTEDSNPVLIATSY